MCFRVRNCCGCNSLEQGSKVIAIIGLVFGGLSSLSGLARLDVSIVLGSILEIVISAMLFHGIKTKKTAFVMAWLVVSMIQIVGGVFWIFAIVGLTPLVDYNWEQISKQLGGEYDDEEGKELLKIIMYFSAALILVITAVNTYLWVVVYSFHKELQLQLGGGDVVYLESGEGAEMTFKTKK